MLRVKCSPENWPFSRIGILTSTLTVFIKTNHMENLHDRSAQQLLNFLWTNTANTDAFQDDRLIKNKSSTAELAILL